MRKDLERIGMASSHSLFCQSPVNNSSGYQKRVKTTPFNSNVSMADLSRSLQ